LIRVLLVSGHPAIRHGLAHVISREPGFVVEASASADAAVEGLWHVEPDVVLIDAPLGPESGFELCHRLKQLAHPQRVAVYASPARDEARVAAWLAGADALIDKSQATDHLLDVIRTAVRGPRTLARPPRTAIQGAAGGLDPPETSIFGMCLYNVPLDEISRTLRIDPLDVEARVHALLGRLGAAA